MPGFFKRSKKNKPRPGIERVSSSKRNNMLIEQKYVDCVKIYCPQKKTKRKGLFKSSTKVVCNEQYLKECIDDVHNKNRVNNRGNTGQGEYNIPLNIMRNQVRGVYVKHQPMKKSTKNLGTYHVGKKYNGTYTSIKPKTSEHNYVEMENVNNPERSAEYVTMKNQKRPVPAPRRKKLKPRSPEPLPRVLEPPKTIKKSSPPIYASLRQTRTSKKSNPNFYAVTRRQGQKQGSPPKKTVAKKPTLPKKPSKLSKLVLIKKRKV